MPHTDFGTLLSMHAWVVTVSNEAAGLFFYLDFGVYLLTKHIEK